MSYYMLDPANYLLATVLSWDSLLLKTKIKFGLSIDIDMVNFIERMRRGGLTFVGSKTACNCES